MSFIEPLQQHPKRGPTVPGMLLLIALLTLLYVFISAATYPDSDQSGATSPASVCKYLSGGNATPCAGDPSRPVPSAPASVTPFATQAAASNTIAKAAPGSLSTLTITTGATSGWVMVFDAVSLPSNGATTSTLKWCYPVVSDGTRGGASFEWPSPVTMATGITIGFSSTACNSLTASATAFFYGQVQ